MTNTEKLYDYLKKCEKKLYQIAMLYWEMDTAAPKKSMDYLIDVKTELELEVFEMNTSDEYKNLLDAVITSGEYETLTKEEQVFIDHEIESYERNSKVPSEFYEKYMKAISNSKLAWKDAKEKKDYLLFKDHLIEVINLTKEYYRFQVPDADDLYDVMLNDYTRGMMQKEITPLFDDLKEKIIPIIKNLKPRENLKSVKCDELQLKEAGYYLLDYIGFDTERGILGVYPHGYTTKLCRDDVRIAFGLDAPIYDFVSTIIHEGGHGIYDQSYGENVLKCPTYEVHSMGLHESQSRFFENILGRNINFWIPIYDDVKKILGNEDTLEEFASELNNAKPSLIRTMADELTYCIHVIIRYEIERDLFNDKITPEELPDVWNKKYKDYLGVDVPDDAQGIMQDVHWSEGSFGYFPSYILGSILDGMLLEKVEEELGSVDDILREGRIKEITKFLQDNIHKYAETYTYSEVCERVCGKPVSADPLVKYFEKKFGA
ncbi:MAG: carboxypeptidase M32 [Clostridia bacterium]|nr:carboxypeptidase M32 [Clostridia bacterium]